MFGRKRKEERHIVPMSWIRRASTMYPFTPDVQELEMGEDWWVFLYNETMESHRANGTVLYGSHSVVPAYTLDTNLSLWNKNLGKASFPIAISGIKYKARDLLSSSKELGKAPRSWLEDIVPGRIKGELHLVGPTSIKRLDEYLLNGVQFERKRVRVLVPHILTKPDGTTIQSVHIIHAFFYEGIHSYWHDQLDCGIRYSIFPNKSSEDFKYLSSYYEYKQGSLTPSTVSSMYQL